MPGIHHKKENPGKHRKHTPIVSEKQRRLFGAVAGGVQTKATSLSKVDAKRHLEEVEGKKLPEQVKRKAFHRVVSKIKHAAKGKRFRVR